MTAQFMVKPSSFLQTGLEITPFGDISLFRFTDKLQSRFETLLEANKNHSLTPDETAELLGMSELSRIFTFINAQMATQATWCPVKLDDGYDNEPNTAANIATPPNS
ncbi:MAG: hypothetical protein SWY16_15415 [Cyanobacteriota bacterium]|nr:hypothetical protein [Cyanobacteriota bacterium]